MALAYLNAAPETAAARSSLYSTDDYSAPVAGLR